MNCVRANNEEKKSNRKSKQLQNTDRDLSAVRVVHNATLQVIRASDISSNPMHVPSSSSRLPYRLQLLHKNNHHDVPLR